MLETSEITPKPALACDLTAIEAEQRDKHQMTTKQLFTQVQEIRELPDGYALRLPSDTDTFLRAAKFVANERLCCPFNFTLELQGASGLFWLKLTGQEGVKQLLQAEFRLD